MTRVLVTGGAGFIGSNLVGALLERGDDVRVLDNFSTGSRRNLAALAREVEVVEGDLRSYERVHTAVRGVEVVFHQGALGSVPRSVQDPLTSTAVIVGSTVIFRPSAVFSRWNVHGMNAVNPPVSSWTSRMRWRCLTRCSMRSPIPNIIVAVERRPTL